MSRIVEEWRDIKGYEGLYQVSDWGRVRRLYRSIPAKLLKQETTHDGYKRIGLWKIGDCKHYGVHRLVAEAFIPNPGNKPCVGHLKTLQNGLEDKTANEVWNIAWMTYPENAHYGTCIDRIISAQKGRKFTEEHKKNISEALKNSEMFHKVVASDEYRQKLRNAQKNNPNIHRNWEELSVQVDQIDMKTGEIMASYPSAKEASRQTGYAQSNISRCCNGGFYWNSKWINVSKAYGFIWKKKALTQLELEQI